MSFLRPSANAKIKVEYLILCLCSFVFLVVALSAAPTVVKIFYSFIRGIKIEPHALGVFLGYVIILGSLGFGIRDGFRKLSRDGNAKIAEEQKTLE